MSEIICKSITNGHEFGMREATKEEYESVNNYIKSISKKLYTFTDEQLAEHDKQIIMKFAEYLADNSYRVMKTISNEIIVVNQHGYKIERKSIDKVIAEWQKGTKE